ncbi:MAG: ATP-binding protein [Desulfuromonadaceae bacterium]|nr:ATP-binding protein [Desulfuromonadaceae bacterium]
MKKVRFSLLFKFMGAIAAVFLVASFVFVVTNVRLQHQLTLENSLHDADYLSEAITRANFYLMLNDDHIMLHRMIDELATMEGIRRIRLFNKDGVINFSTDESETGQTLALSAEGCSGCHLSKGAPLVELPSAARGRTFKDENGEVFLGVTKPIYNDPSCYTAACHHHPPDKELLGILDVQISLKKRMSQVDTFRNFFIVLVCVLLILLFMELLVLTKSLIIAPVRRIIAHQRKIAAGDLSGHIEIKSYDELGELAAGANEMTASLLLSQQEVQAWANTLEDKVQDRTRYIQEMQANLARSERLAALGKLVAGIAHEINNPLTGILTYSSMAEERDDIDQELRDDLRIITHETQRCAEIVRGLLDFGRESIPTKKYTAVDTLLDKSLALLEHQSIFQDILIHRNYAEDMPQIEVDPNQLEQVFMNLFLNAAHSMPGGGSLSIDTWQDVDKMMIAISDSGSGISTENLTKIFDPFFSTKDQQGTGLGLSVSYGIIKNHGGTIEVESTEGVGTRFLISLLMGDLLV